MKRSIRSTNICFLFIALATAVSLRSARCDSAPSITYEREDLYSEGLKAYKTSDYVTALKDLFAFNALNEKQFQATPSEEIKKVHLELARAIADSETKLQEIVEWSHVGGLKLSH
jgi:outer membrane protein assembly factor BamD (BamD/ComL family)